jgi:radical SAM family RiPP maturation amino acid epimerase
MADPLPEPAPESILPLLGGLQGVSSDYLEDVARIKRALERWTMDPGFRQAFEGDAEAAIASLGVALRPEEIIPFIDDGEAIALRKAEARGEDGSYPLSVRRYRGYIREKMGRRRQIRAEAQPTNERFAAWRARQINRCAGQLGIAKADALIHAPAAFELAKGCSVGCWFCGVAAPRLDQICRYTDNAAVWRETLTVLREILGSCSRHSFCYWATDPLDNPDYESFLADFHQILGRWPQTTTAIPTRNVERTRSLLRLAHAMGSEIDRFSILTLKVLSQVHLAFTPEELLRVELIPQNREAGGRYRKAHAGRARRFASTRAAEMVPEETGSTIACISGFLFNMVERSVRLVTPCSANERWPLGYWTLEEGYFASGEDLRDLLLGMIRRHMQPALRVDSLVRLRPDVRWELDGEDILLRSRWLKITLRQQQRPREIGELITAGDRTAGEIALHLERAHGVDMPETFFFLNNLFKKGLLDEEPPQREVSEPSAKAVA